MPAAPLSMTVGRRVGGVEGLLERLNADVSTRLMTAYAPNSKGPLQSAISAFARFAAACPDRDLFIRPRFNGDLASSAHNEWTLMLFAWYLTSVESSATKRTRKVKTARSYISLLKGYFEFSYSFALVERGGRLKRLLDAMTSDEPLGGVRRKRRGWRRRHMRRIWHETWVRANDVNAVNQIAAVGTAWQVLARGGEVCPSVSHAGWRAGREPTRADLEFGETGGGARFARLWLRPLKQKGQSTPPKIPQYIAEPDGGGSDTYMLLERMVQLDPVPEAERAHTPLFRQRVLINGHYEFRHMTVAHLRSTVRKYAKALGHSNPHEWGAHSLRIGGATDLASTGRASELVLKAKGRWASDIGVIYSRLTR